MFCIPATSKRLRVRCGAASSPQWETTVHFVIYREHVCFHQHSIKITLPMVERCYLSSFYDSFLEYFNCGSKLFVLHVWLLFEQALFIFTDSL